MNNKLLIASTFFFIAVLAVLASPWSAQGDRQFNVINIKSGQWEKYRSPFFTCRTDNQQLRFKFRFLGRANDSAFAVHQIRYAIAPEDRRSSANNLLIYPRHNSQKEALSFDDLQRSGKLISKPVYEYVAPRRYRMRFEVIFDLRNQPDPRCEAKFIL